MSYLGRATDIKFETKLNGTHTLTFQLPDKYFDSEKGDYVRNEFVDNLFNERKIKLYFLGEWYEFYIKSVSDTKHFKSYMKKYSCTDAFIDELSRNGYGITFDTELYNNVEEIGTFSRVILEDSIWSYAPEHNWGDFTEYLEEKLFRVPVSLFSKLVGHKLTYQVVPREGEQIINAFTQEKRGLELGDDLAAAVDGKGGYFWDAYDGTMPLMHNVVEDIPNDGYIYIPYSQLEFCYKTTSEEGYAATEEVCYYGDKSYAIAPATVDPTALIQFMAIPKGAEVEIDEAGLILNKDFTYVMTVQEWNDNLNSEYYYKFLPKTRKDIKTFTHHSGDLTYEEAAVGNKAAYYEGYLDRINDLEVLYGKKISVTDRTEVNITDEIDQYVKVYNQKFDSEELVDLYTNPDDLWQDVDGISYRVCSKTDTRQIVPQLARNYLQNGTKIKTTDGWEPCRVFVNDNQVTGYYCTNLQLRVGTTESNVEQDYVTQPDDTFLEVFPCVKSYASVNVSSGIKTEISHSPAGNDDRFDYYNTIINFGMVGQEKKIVKDTVYCLGLRFGLETKYDNSDPLKSFVIRIGEGKVITSGEYDILCPASPIDEEYENGICLRLDKIITSTGKTKRTRVKTADSRKEEEKVLTIYEGYLFIKFDKNIENPYFAITASNSSYTTSESGTYEGQTYNQAKYNTIPNYYLFNSYFFEAYTKGIDQFDTAEYRYSGRELYDLDFKYHDSQAIIPDGILNCGITDIYDTDIHNKIIFEEDVMPGDTYAYQKYFIQQVIAYDVDEETGLRTGGVAISDTFAQKEILSDYADLIAFKNTNVSHHDLPYSAAQFSNDDLEIATKYIDLNKCKYYNKQSNINTPDCSYGGEHICLYQKYGYCPYLFETEKHCRKIRTLNGEKSNRFNLTQELSKVFEIYPIYWTEHYENGKIKTDTVECDEETKSLYGTDTYERMRKKLFYIREKGMENKLGFRYEKNLSSISRDIKSDQIVTKLYVSDVDSELSKTGLCSIKTAEDNPSKDSFIINFNYYTTKGILDKNMVDADLYGKGEGDQGYLKQLGYLNTEYDKLSNAIINLSNSSFNELQANVETNVKGIETAQKQLFKLKKGIAMYESKGNGAAEANKENQSYQNQITKYNEQLNILNNLIYETFFDQVTDKHLDITDEDNLVPIGDRSDVMTFFDEEGHDIKWMEESPWFKQHTYNVGMLGQFNKEYLQIAEWKKKQSYYLKEINKLALKFFRKYEPYLKEGTWSDSNYLSDNAYYFGAVQVAADGSIPKVSYNISVVDLYALPEYKDYLFNIADTTYVEDIGMFGINPITGLPNRLKVIISGITYNLDEPSKNSISVQNFTTQFADLFQQVTASVQSLSFNENIYKRASNFTSNQNIDQESLQGTLDTNEMQLIDTDETNIQINKEGQSGSDINNHNNKYRLNGQGMEFSNNGGQTWNIGVGPGGINADYIKVGTLDAGKIRIVDNNYLYFLWDKNGISAFRDPQSLQSSQEELLFNDYALFNRYGLSLVEKGKIRLRAGYSFNGSNPENSSETNAWGKINTEETQGEDIGFYLYNNKGQPIFYSAVKSNLTDEDAKRESAKVYLIGEMYVSDKISASGDPTGASYKYTGGYTISSSQISLYKNMADFTPVSYDIEDVQVTTPIPADMIYKLITVNGNKSDLEYQLYLTLTNIYDSTKANNIYRILFNDNQYDIRISKVNNSQQALINVNGVKHWVSQTTDEYSIDKVNVDTDNNYNITVRQNLEKIWILTYGNGTYYTSSVDDVKETVQLLTAKDDVATGYGGNVEQTTVSNLFDISARRPSVYDAIEESKILYPLSAEGFNYWLDKTQINGEAPVPAEDERTAQVALYLNNTNIKDGYAANEERIFCIAGDMDSTNRTVKNFFTVRKDGSLYIGGTVTNTDGSPIPSAARIPDEVNIEAPLLKAVKDEKTKEDRIYIDFDRFYNTDGKSLYESLIVVGGSVGQHRHTLETAIAIIDANGDGEFNYLPDGDASPSNKLYYNSAGGQQETTVGNVIKQLVSGYSESERWTGFYTILYNLMTQGYVEYSPSGTMGEKVQVRFNNKVLGAGGEFKLTFKNSTTGDVIGGGGGGGRTQAYGLLDPGNAERE